MNRKIKLLVSKLLNHKNILHVYFGEGISPDYSCDELGVNNKYEPNIEIESVVDSMLKHVHWTDFKSVKIRKTNMCTITVSLKALTGCTFTIIFSYVAGNASDTVHFIVDSDLKKILRVQVTG